MPARSGATSRSVLVLPPDQALGSATGAQGTYPHDGSDMSLSTLGMVHTVGASVGLATGAFQLLRPRQDALHRRVGYCFVAAMVLANVSVLAIYKFTGGFNLFHGLALYNLLGVALALRPMLQKPRPYQWRRMHYMWIAWAYTGLCAAATTEFLLRVLHFPGWTSAAVGTPPVILLGWWLIRRSAPPLRAPAQAPG